ncbi:caspase family protein [Arthrobacter sp. SA17]
MKRAAVIVGVRKSGSLPVLPAAIPGARAMERWALEQGMDRSLVKTFTDEDGPLEPSTLKTAVKELVDLSTIDQLIIYFAGHGFSSNLEEYWLLSNAPEDSDAAINVAGSIASARASTIPHVVFFSDACRTAAEGLHVQAIGGQKLFPNVFSGGTEMAVDIFFACTLGRAAYESKDVSNSAAQFKAAYTEALLAALSGKRREILVPEEPPKNKSAHHVKPYGLVRPWDLKDHLQYELVNNFHPTIHGRAVSQVPDARITSRAGAWVSRVKLPSSGGKGGAVPRIPRIPSIPSIPAHEGRGVVLQDVSDFALRSALDIPPLTHHLRKPVAHETPGAAELNKLSTNISMPFGPDRFETGCGFKIRGSECISAYALNYGTEIIDPDWELSDGEAGPDPTQGQLIRIWTDRGTWGTPPADSVHLIFQDHSSVLLPAIPNFLTTVTFDEEGALTDVTYEPSALSERRTQYDDQLQNLRNLRGIVAAASNFGIFRLEGDQAPALARRMRVAKGLDPSMALYAAYAYHDQGNSAPIRKMDTVLHNDLGFSLFDVAMLAGKLTPNQERASRKPFGSVCPMLPLISRGWPLLDAYGIDIPAPLRSLRTHLRQSLWTLFDGHGTDLVSEYLRSKETR